MREPTLSGPLPGSPNLISGPAGRTLPAGWVEEEWFLDGEAVSYAAAGELGADGRWQVSAAEPAPFTTRLIVRRPIDPARHNGTVVVEWLNVSAGADSAPDWGYSHRHLGRAGFAWVGVSAQRAGIAGGGFVPGPFLKQADPERYAPLAHPGDSWAFDIFTRAGRAVRSGTGGLLGPLQPERVIAVGESQSAIFLTTYVNAVAPLEGCYDGYLVHSRSGAAAPLASPRATDAGPDLDAVRALRTDAVRIRDDLAVPVLTLQSETDVIAMGSVASRQPDSDHFRLWEVAGASHAETYLLAASFVHDDDLSIAELARLCAPTREPFGPLMATATPVNSGPQHHYVAQAAIAHLDRWVRDGTAPPEAPRLEVTGEPAALALDGLGIARGGIRTGFVDVPTAVLSGLGQDGAAFAFLFGTTRPFDADTLRGLYPGGRDEYAKRFADATADAVRAGFVLADDAEEMSALAVAMFPS